MTLDPPSQRLAETKPQDDDLDARAVTPSATPSWLDQEALLRQLWEDNKSPEAIAEKLNRSVAAIMTRAARLGLPRRSAPGRKRGYKKTDAPRRITIKVQRVKISASAESAGGDTYAPPQVSMRVCLMCLNKFQSLGRFNRICPSCKGSADYATGSSTPDFTFRVTN